MTFSKVCSIFLIFLMTTTLFSACGGADESSGSALNSDAGILRFVPADTPYVMAKPGDLPDDVTKKLDPYVDATLKGYHSILRAMLENAYAQAREEDSNLEAYESLLPVVDELEGLMSLEGLRRAGIESDADVAVYGIGLLPVFRLQLTDGDLLEATLARLEESAKQKMSVADFQGHTYRYAGDDDGRIVVAIIDNDLVVTAVPADLPDNLFSDILGLTLPAQNIASSGTVAKLADSFGFSDHMIAMVDFERVAATFLDPQSGVNAELLAAMEYDQSVLGDVCRSEIRSLVGVMPRAVAGYTGINAQEMSSKLVFELREDIAKGVATMAGAVPGMAEPAGGLFSFGMSTDLLAARTFYAARLDALEADPYECELLAEFQEGVAAGREVLNQPIPPVAYGFNGFLAVIEDLQGMDLANNQPPTSADMRVLIAMDNAEALVAMGAMFSPELAAMNLAADGVPVKLNMAQVAASGMDMFVAMTDNALAISVGDNMEAGLGEMLRADAPDPSPFLILNMDTQKYVELFGDAMIAQSVDSDEMPEVQDAAQAMKKAFVEVFDEMRMVVNLTAKGVEIESQVMLTQ